VIGFSGVDFQSQDGWGLNSFPPHPSSLLIEGGQMWWIKVITAIFLYALILYVFSLWYVHVPAPPSPKFTPQQMIRVKMIMDRNTTVVLSADRTFRVVKHKQ
jgi:uncharacterized membrane protein YedE/YeeE